MQSRIIKPTVEPTAEVLNLENPRSLICASVLRILSGLMQERFFGSIELKFEAGNLVVLKKTETLKTEDICRNNRGNDERDQPR